MPSTNATLSGNGNLTLTSAFIPYFIVLDLASLTYLPLAATKSCPSFLSSYPIHNEYEYLLKCTFLWPPRHFGIIYYATKYLVVFIFDDANPLENKIAATFATKSVVVVNIHFQQLSRPYFCLDNVVCLVHLLHIFKCTSD